MLQVRAIRFSKADLDGVPRHHRLAFLGLCQIADETTILQRTAVAAINSIAPPRPVEDMAKATALLGFRMLVGRLWEARLFLNRPEVATSLRELTIAALERDARSQIEIDKATAARASLLQRLDAPGGLVRQLRNRASFHTDIDFLEAGYDALQTDADLMDHIGEFRGASIHGAAEALHLAALCALLGEADPNRAFSHVIADAMPAVMDLSSFIDAFVGLFLISHFYDRVREANMIDIPQAEPINRLQSPMFFSDAE